MLTVLHAYFDSIAVATEVVIESIEAAEANGA